MRSSSIWLCIALPALLSASFSQAQTPTEADAGGTGTAADRRHVPGFRLQHVVWLLVPRGTPQAIVSRLNADLNRALSNPAVIQRFTQTRVSRRRPARLRHCAT